MLQGFYIFAIFVCKRNVYNAILKKTGRYNPQSQGVNRRRMAQSGSGAGVTSGTRMTQIQSEPLS